MPEAEQWFLEWQRCAGELARTRDVLAWTVRLLVVMAIMLGATSVLLLTGW